MLRDDRHTSATTSPGYTPPMLALLALLGTTALEPHAESPRRERPNVVILLADDLGRHEISLNGGPVPTPNIDRVGREGANCTAGTVVSPICAPSRAGLLTGRYPQRFGFEYINHERYAKSRFEHFAAHFFAADDQWQLAPYAPAPPNVPEQGLPESERTLADALRAAGYATEMVGKWHLGSAPGKRPLERGFDHHYGFYGAFSLYAPEDDPTILSSHHSYFADKHEWETARSGTSAIVRDGQPIDEPGFLTQRIAEEAVASIRAHAREPFFLYVPFSAPHTPFQAPRSYTDGITSAKDDNQRVYRGMIAALDDAVGQILDSLDEQGLTDDTLVFFLSDNGGALYTNAADNSPLRGGKFSNLEGGVGVPYLVRFPGRVAPGASCADPVSALDVFPTALAAAGQPLPGDRPYDGVNILPYLRGESPAPHQRLYWRTGTHAALRSGDWKLIVDRATGWRGLYDLAADPTEQQNLAARDPQRVQELEGQLADWETELIPPAWPNVMEYHWPGGEMVFPL